MSSGDVLHGESTLPVKRHDHGLIYIDLRTYPDRPGWVAFFEVRHYGRVPVKVDGREVPDV